MDLNIAAPVTPRPPVILADPATPNVEAKFPAPVIFIALPPNMFPLTPTPPVTINAPDVEDEAFVLLVIVCAPSTWSVDLNVVAPVTPSPP